MNKSSKIYIAGHRGLVGSSLVRKLKEGGFAQLVTRTSNELDLTRQADVDTFFEKERPEFVFLAAAKVGGILANSTYKAEFIYQNIMIAANVIHASYKYGVRKLLNLGSSCIYPKLAPQPMKEEHLLTGPLEPTNEPYAMAKISAIKLCRYYNEQYGTNFISAMPANLYGPNDNFNLETSHVLPALMRKMHLGKCLQNGDFESIRKDLQKYPICNHDVTQREDGEIVDILSGFGIKNNNSKNLHPPTFGLQPQASNLHPPTSNLKPPTSSLQPQTVVELWGSGSPYREFLYVDDLADACIFLMQRYDAREIGEFVNIGTGEDLKIKEIAELVMGVIGYKGKIQWDTSKPDGMPKKLLDISKIMAMGWQPKINLEDGIVRTYNWYLERLNTRGKSEAEKGNGDIKQSVLSKS